jgi:pre-mRNA-splicing factor ATP-dependent RNA helicase DHX38/PRP16
MLTGIPSNLHPSSALFGLGYTPDYVVYHELIMTSKEYMSCVTAVEGEWLAEMGPMFFTVKESYKTRLIQKQHEKKEIIKMEVQMNMAQNTASSSRGILSLPSTAAAIKKSILTPGLIGKNTPRRTPLRMGL